MYTKEKAIQIISESEISVKSPITIHIGYNHSLTLKEFSDVLDRINKAINDVNRDNGIRNNAILGKEYAAEVAGVDSGSIVLHIFTYIVEPVFLSVVGNFIYDRLKNIGAKKEEEDTAYPISINVNGDNNLIEINITKPNNNYEKGKLWYSLHRRHHRTGQQVFYEQGCDLRHRRV